MNKQYKGNILLFPNLAERCFEMAMEARDQQKFNQAKEYLEQAVKLEPDSVAAVEALIATYHELNMYSEAELLAEKVLLEGWSGNEDVFRLYILTLIHMQKHGKAYDLLAELVHRGELPPDLKKEYEEILDACQQLMQAEMPDEDEAPFLKEAVQEKLKAEQGYLNRLLTDLENGDFEQQLQSIEQLKYAYGTAAADALEEYVAEEENDPLLKTQALQALKELGAKEKVKISKFGQRLEVEIKDVPTSEEDLGEQAESVMLLLMEQTYHHDPIFSSFACQLWIDFIYASYPLTPKVRNPESWAAALHYATGKLLDQPLSQKDIASFYGTTAHTISKHYKRIEEVLNLEGRNING